jgi:hypothetical protein
MHITGVTQQELTTSLNQVYLRYGKPLQDKPKWEKLLIQVWNAVKHVFGQSDWQIASKKLGQMIYLDGSKYSDNFKGIAFHGLREDVFSPSEAREIANLFLTQIVRKSHKPFQQALGYACKHLDRYAGEVLFKKFVTNPEMFPSLNIQNSNFIQASRKKQTEIIFESCSGHFEKTASLLKPIDEPYYQSPFDSSC